MSYTPYTWQSGDTVTAARLNNIEQGVANVAPLFLTVAEAGLSKSDPQTQYILSKTYAELKPYIGTNSIYLLVPGNDATEICSLAFFHEQEGEGYFVGFSSTNGLISFTSQSENSPLVLNTN